MTSFIPKRNVVVHLIVFALYLILISVVNGETLIAGKRTTKTSEKVLDSDKTQRSLSDRIISGTPAKLGEFPSFVFAGCGGSLIRPDLVLTAAHCYSSFEGEGKVRVGGITRETGQLIDIEEIINHPKYDDDILKNDIAIIKLKCGSRAPLQKLHLNNFNPKGRRKLIAIGMGLTGDNIDYSDGLLNKITLNHIPLRACRDKWQSGQKHPIHRGNICAQSSIEGNGKSPCYGDSGSPLVYNSTALSTITNASSGVVQVGVTSWGYECNGTDYPGVYTRVSSYKGFIEETIAKYSTPVPNYCE